MGKPKTLPDHIKEIIKTHGQGVVKDIRLSSILNDVASFDEVPAAKIVLRVLLKGGYGSRLLELENSTREWQLRVTAFASEISSKYGYQKDIVDYLLASIVYGLGWTSQKPSYDGVGQPREINSSAKPEYAISDLSGELVQQKKEYERLLGSLLVIPAKTSAYYPASALTQLGLVEGKIRLLSEALKTNDLDWCKKAKERVLNAHIKDSYSIKKKTYSMVAAITAIAIIGGTYGTSYVSSLGDMESFDQTVQKGDGFRASGLYNQAIASYNDAYTNYNAFNSSSYKDDAFQRIEQTIDKLIEAGKTDCKSLLYAQQSLQSELQLDLSSSQRKNLQDKLKIVETEKTKIIENGKNTLILNISANKGGLDSEGKELLEDLLSLSPKDYWLNFIKNKEK